MRDDGATSRPTTPALSFFVHCMQVRVRAMSGFRNIHEVVVYKKIGRCEGAVVIGVVGGGDHDSRLAREGGAT